MKFSDFALPLSAVLVATILGLASGLRTFQNSTPSRPPQPQLSSSETPVITPPLIAPPAPTTRVGTDADDPAAYDTLVLSNARLPFEPPADAIPPRKTVTTHGGKPITVTPERLTRSETDSGWRSLLLSQFDVACTSPTLERLASSASEKTAVYAALWNALQQTNRDQLTMFALSVPRNGTGTTAQRDLYSVLLSATNGTAKRPLQLKFVSETALASVIDPTTVRRSTNLSDIRISYFGFPSNNITSYWDAHREAYNATRVWLSQVAVGEFSRTLVFAAPSSVVVHCRGVRESEGQWKNLELHYLGQQKPIRLSETSALREIDSNDVALWRLCNLPRTSTNFTLGMIYGLREVPESERYAVKCLSLIYLEDGCRDTELDLRVPRSSGQPSIPYTLRFQEGAHPREVDIVVSRIGDAVTDTAGGTFSLAAIDGYRDHNSTSAELAAWWNSRYPSCQLRNTNLVNLESNMIRFLTTGAGKSEWFEKNYAITILDSSGAAKRLKRTHKLSSGQLGGLKDFSKTELENLERSLQMVDVDVLRCLRGTHLIRQRSAEPRADDPASKTAGLTYIVTMDGRVDSKSILIFDAAAEQESNHFIGGSKGISTPFVCTLLHEMGHVLGAYDSKQLRFNAEHHVDRIKAITWYAATEPSTEFYPEAFSLFYADPEWLSNNRPLIYEWFKSQRRPRS